MDEKRKRMGALGWSVVTLAVLVANPLSVGPVAWICSKKVLPVLLCNLAEEIYAPVVRFTIFGPGPLASALRWYLHLWVP